MRQSLALFATDWHTTAQGLRKKGDNMDVAYQAVMSAAKAAVARGITIKTLFESDPWDEPFVELVIPVVVIETQLYEYFLDEDEENRLRRIPSGLLSFGNPIPGHNQATLVYIVTKEGLPEFASSLAGLSQHWFEGTSRYYDQLVSSFEKHRKLKSTDGVYGNRFTHNTEGTVRGLTVTKP
jgi:hypothetical protein